MWSGSNRTGHDLPNYELVSTSFDTKAYNVVVVCVSVQTVNSDHTHKRGLM